MSDSEKLMALKKAYAEIILNTAKEAAARIMVSERKAIRYEQELLAAKEDALRMLLRLKRMLDAKVNDAQMTSVSQQQKIDELEAQLGEAEDIVKDLRAELREAQDELERATCNQKQFLDEHNMTGDIATQITPLLENRLDTSVAVMPSLPDIQPGSVQTSYVKNSTLNGTNENKNCYNENDSHSDKCHFCNSGLASIVMRKKQPKLYRSGCTQRIHAYERNLLEENLSRPGQLEEVKKGTSAEEDEGLSKNLDPVVDQTCGVENNPNESKLMQANSNSTSDEPVKSFRMKRKRAARYKKSTTLSARNFPDQVEETTQKSDISSKTSLHAVDNYVEHEEEPKSFEKITEKNPDSQPVSNSPSEMKLQSGCGEVTKSDAVKNTTKNDYLVIDQLELKIQESRPAESTELSACKTYVEVADLSSVNLDVRSSILTEGLTAQSLNKNFLKYTFQRKRKKESLSSPDGYSSLEEGCMKRKMMVNGLVESEKSTLATESSQDHQNLLQVACQLMSLSEMEQP